MGVFVYRAQILVCVLSLCQFYLLLLVEVSKRYLQKKKKGKKKNVRHIKTKKSLPLFIKKKRETSLRLSLLGFVCFGGIAVCPVFLSVCGLCCVRERLCV